MDLVEIARIENALLRPRFASKILTPREREFCLTPARVAGRWAAKEAIAKAVGLPLDWHDVEILPDATGAPKAVVKSRHFDPRRLRLHVTITHERTHAAAVAVLERLVIQAR